MESERVEFTGIDGVTRRKRLKDVEGVLVAKGPGREGQQREQTADQADAERPREPKRATAIENERGKEDDCKQGAIGQAAPLATVEVPASCLALVVGGPQLAYPTAIVDAIIRGDGALARHRMMRHLEAIVPWLDRG